MHTLFVGRAAELDALAEQWRSAVTEQPRFVLLDGPGGTGKSALLAVFRNRAGGARAVGVTGDEAESLLPFGLVDQITSQLSGNRPPGATADETPRDPFVVGAALLQQLADSQEVSPLALIIDDAHLIDGPSLAALTFALRRLSVERVLVVAAARQESLIRLPPGLVRLASDRGIHLHVGGLSVAELRELAVLSGFGELTFRSARRLQEHTGGNPLHVRALFAELAPAELDTADRPLPAPKTLSMLLRSALAVRSETARHLAVAAAVLGRRCKLDACAALAAIPDPIDAVEELQTAAIVNLETDRDGHHVVFDHPLVHAAVYEGIPAGTRRSLHLSAAGMSSGAESLRHRVAAASGSDGTLVADLQAEAATARGVGAWQRAARALLAARQYTQSANERQQLLLNGVQFLLLDGDMGGVLGHSQALADLPAEPPVLLLQARIAWLTGQPDVAASLATDAWQRARDCDARSSADAAALLAQLCILQDDAEAAHRWAHRALEAGVLTPEEQAISEARVAIGLALDGRVEEGLRILACSDVPTADPAYLHISAGRGTLRLWGGDVPGACEDLATCRNAPGHPSGAGTEPHRLVALTYLAESLYRHGDWNGSSALAEHVVSLAADTGQLWLAAFTNATASFAPAARGQWDIAQVFVDAALEAAGELKDQASRGYADNAAIHLAALRGDSKRVVEAASRLAAKTGPAHEPGIFNWPVFYAAALVDLGRYDDAEAILTSMNDLAISRSHRPRLSAVARIRGDLAAKLRDTASARRLFQTAVELADPHQDALDHAITNLAYGRFLRRRGERRSAVERLSEARSQLIALGAEPLLSKCIVELESCGVSGIPNGKARHELLTPQETAVAQLVVSGLSNRQIADELVLSVKTIAYHLGHVYSKLGVSSRMELAVRMGIRQSANN
jgi:ATP/maltotriose-dependent transcriptional regulator MalT